MSDELKYYYLKIHPLFTTLTEEQVLSICMQVKVINMDRGETIHDGDGTLSKLYLLLKGKIKLTETDETGNELIKDILTEGECFGDLSLEGFMPPGEQAVALLTNTVVGWFAVSGFKDILEHYPAVAVRYVQKVSNRLKRLEDRHADLVFRDARARLIRFIRDWARTDGSRIGDKIVLNNYLTHSDIAGFISTSRQSVNVLLNELRDSGKLSYNRKRIELTDEW